MKQIGEIVEILTKKQGQVPVLVKFSNGSCLPSSKNRIDSGVFIDTKSNKQCVLAATDKLVYKGEIQSSKEDCLVNSYIAIRNKKTNKVRLVEIDICHVSAVIEEPVSLFQDEEQSRVKSYSELNKTFGSKKQKLRTEQKERMKVNVDVVKDQLEETIKNVSMNIDNADISTKISEVDAMSPFAPPMNREASNVDQVYQLADLISSEELDSLYNAAEQALTGDLSEFKLSPFVQEHIQSLRDSTSPNRTLNCAILLYIEGILYILQASTRTISMPGLTVCPWSGLVDKAIINKFTAFSSTGRKRSNTMRDKCIAYITVLSLLALDFCFRVDTLAKSMKSTPKKLSEVAIALGVSKVVRNKKNCMVLKLPLPPPNSLIIRKRNSNHNRQ